MNETQVNEVTQNILDGEPICDSIFYSYSIPVKEIKYELQEEFQNFYGFDDRELLTMYNCINNLSKDKYDRIEHRLMLLSFWITCPPEMYPPYMEFGV